MLLATIMGDDRDLSRNQRTYIPNNRPSSDYLSLSRIQQDLSGSLHHDTYMEQVDGVDSPMIRRVASKIPHVCVVGAGVSGLRCADILLQHGAKVTILEGRDRVGGRVRLDVSNARIMRRLTAS
jgi:alanine dehydrogenase